MVHCGHVPADERSRCGGIAAETRSRGGDPRTSSDRQDDTCGDGREALRPSERSVWRLQLIRTYLERDIPSLGIRLAPATFERFWSMLAHDHGQTWNSAELARAFGVSDKTIRNWIEILESTFMVRTLRPWRENLGTRVVRSPKLYLSDSGLLHSLLRIGTMDDLSRHPKIGASFGGFAIAQVVRRLGVPWPDCHFWATHRNAELDLLGTRGRRRIGFEIKHTVAPEWTRSMAIAIDDFRLDRLDVIHLGSDTFDLAPKIRAVAFSRLFEDVEPV